MKYLNFNGTATRSEYWGVAILSTIAMFILTVIGTGILAFGNVPGILVGSVIIFAAIVLYLWVFIAVAVKRCRDCGINAWWTAACFVPYIGWITWIVLGCLPTENKN